MGDGIWLPDRRLYEPTHAAAAPWDPRVVHGGAVSGLIAQVVSSKHGAHLVPSRMNVDLLRMASFAPVRVDTFIVHERTRSMVVDVLVWSSDDLIALARVLLLRADPDDGYVDELPPIKEPNVRIDESIAVSLRPNSDARVGGFDVRVGMIPGTERTLLWLRIDCPMLAGQETSGFARAAFAADWTNAVANGTGESLDWINADANLSCGREPATDWLAIVLRQQIVSDGRSTSTCALFDEGGSFGTATVSSVPSPRRTMSF